MRIVSPFLKKVFYPALWLAGVFHGTSAPGLAVVTYHGVLPEGYEPVDSALDGNLISPEVLGRQLRLLKAHYHVISPEDALAWLEGQRELPPRAVLLTCDDGLLNCLTDMLPVLRQEKVSCLFFVTGASTEESRTMLWYEELFLLFLRAPAGHFEISSEGILIQGQLGSLEQRRSIWWNSVKRLSQVDSEKRELVLHVARIQLKGNQDRGLREGSAWCRRFGLLTRGELQELASAGMTIGAHTLSHPMLSQLPPQLARAEICESRARLESVLEKPVWAFAYPFGDPQSVTPQVLAMAEQAGFQAAFLNFGGGLGTALPPYALPRLHVTAGMSLAEFETHVCGFHERLQRVLGRRSQSAATTPGAGIEMTGRSAATNLQTYNAPEVAAHYATLDYLTPCERVLFEIYIPAGGAILDLGVGGGRTTSYLAKRASRYVGVDYAPAMVKACEAKFPGLEFQVADAANLSLFPDASFDAVVFAFNGIDYVLPEQSRQSCFAQVHRVLKANGIFIFSSHNARAVLVRPRWNRMRLRQTARRLSGDLKILYWLWLTLLTAARSALAFAHGACVTLLRVLKRISSGAFWRGEGNLVDSAHGGLLTHYSIPSRVINELEALCFRPERILGDDYPQPSHPYATDWYYYVFAKPCEK
ncbi:MAG: methyltransferase domain-containing protein [Candidatus Sulfotelmatobacter sp.]